MSRYLITHGVAPWSIDLFIREDVAAIVPSGEIAAQAEEVLEKEAPDHTFRIEAVLAQNYPYPTETVVSFVMHRCCGHDMMMKNYRVRKSQMGVWSFEKIGD